MAEGEMGQTPAGQLAEDLRAISDRGMRLPDLDTRFPDEIVDFDEYGLSAADSRGLTPIGRTSSSVG
jgi:hypothetical protein